MKRDWTDRDGVEWEVQISGPSSMGVPSDYRPGRPAPKGTIIFRGLADGHDMGYGTEDPGWGPVEKLTNEELKELLNRAKREV